MGQAVGGPPSVRKYRGMMQIGNVALEQPLILAPMAGITDQYFRLLLKRIGGVGLVTMEFISSEALTRGNEKTRHMMQFSEEERPLAIHRVGLILGDPDRSKPRTSVPASQR